jgi:membrane-associated phospholipid phosphatase
VKKLFLLAFLVLFFFSLNLYGQTNETFSIPPFPQSIMLVFHDLGWNALGSFTYNYGTNYLFAGLGTYFAIESGFDLYWRNLAYDNIFLEQAGIPAVYIGVVVPIVQPFAVYIAGLGFRDPKLQVLGLALTQSLALTAPIQAGLKLLTGRAEPGISDVAWHTRGARDEDNSGVFNWFSTDFLRGWPSGHVAHAFSTAAIVSEIYKDNLWLKAGIYSYAALMGLFVSFNVHWASEIFAGALVGYAMGKTIGRSFSQLLGNNKAEDKFSFFVMPNGAGVAVRVAWKI